MHVLEVCRSFPHHRPGGMEWHAEDVVQGLIAAGHTVSILTTPLPDSPALHALRTNGDVITCGRRPGTYDFEFFRQLRGALADALPRLQPDVVHAQGFAGAHLDLLLSGAGVPLVTTVHGTLWSETPLRVAERPRLTARQRLALAWRFKHRLLFAPKWRRFLRAAEALIVDSEFTAFELRTEEPRLRAVPDVVHLGFDMARFPMGDRAEARARWQVSPEQRLMVIVSRLDRGKGVERAIDAFTAAAQEQAAGHAQLFVAGDGALRGELEARPVGRADVRFVGKLGGPDLAALLHAADWFLNADEGAPAFGLSNAEALCMGTPVIASDRGAHREVLAHDATGVSRLVKFDALDEAVSAALKSAPDSDARRAQRAEAARAAFSRDRMTGQLIDVFESAISRSSPSDR